MKIRYADGSERTPEEACMIWTDIRTGDGDTEVVAVDDEAAAYLYGRIEDDEDTHAHAHVDWPLDEQRACVARLNRVW